ncbi:ABC transporter ATP-binding protein [Novosphingobium cyanobacteriorum]|uniref:ABC transporter ATP-binding protein n=1 Tax=Novosphingobium cyanobacteriorum TaxID=3024215 RepID=A0ABT6CLF8_9SPHN|nr:ABC transporter ATP-binding protein [Novosphingobium cyanobacteriorum]MDF8334751.1 ABC transporter ATP-binding protein [Novosphingobium cyanobacteriorum]
MAEWRTYRRLLPWLKPYRGRFAVVLLISLAATAVGLVQPYLSKMMIDQALMKRDLTALAVIAGAMVGVTLGGYVLNIAASYRYVQLSAGMLYDIRVALLRHLQTLSPRFYGGFRLGDLMSRINSDVSDVQRAAGDSLLAALGNVFALVGCVAMMVWLDWRLFLVGSVLVPFAVAVFIKLQQRLVNITREMRERGADLGSLLVDTVMGMRTIAALGAEEHEIQRFSWRNRAFVQTMLRMQVASFMAGALPGTLLAASTSAVMLYGGWRIIEGYQTIGSLVAFMAYHGRVFAPVQSLLGLGSTLASTRVSLARIFELFDTPADVSGEGLRTPLNGLRGGLELQNVHFSHGREANLKGLNLTIPAGAFCAVLGESGAGKSTLADLLVRFLDPQSGRVLFDGVDARDIVLADLRRTVLLVDQSPTLFNMTIAANIAFAVEDAAPEAVAAAARDAGLGPLIARLPQGLETPVGERGLQLSAGERHRIALARALLRKPAVLILDEPTAALDSGTEARVVQGLRAALPEATLIVITHKPALAEAADMVVTLKDGEASVTERLPEHA